MNYQLLSNLYLQKPVNEDLIKSYFSKKKVTFFNWEFFDQDALEKEGQYFFEFDYSIEKTKTYAVLEKEKNFLTLLDTLGVEYEYLKIMPDEEIPFLWPEVELRKGNSKLKKEIFNFSQKVQAYISEHLSPKVKVVLLSKLIKKYKLSTIYERAYLEVLYSFNADYSSSLVSKEKFQEDIEFRKTHYTKKAVLPEKLIKDLAVKMFAVFAAETSILLYLEKQTVLPNLVLVSNESKRAIKKYETLRKIENRPALPKIFVL